MQNIMSIAGRQFRSYFNGPVAYITAALVLLFVGLLVWSTFFLSNKATASEVFTWFGIAMVFAAPALTMGLIAEERRSGTLELLLTMPVKESEVILGKYLGAFGLFVVVVALTIINPIAISTLGDLDWGTVFTGYLGLILQGASMLAIGMMASSLAENQLVAFFISFFFLAFFGWVAPLVLGFLSTGFWATFFQVVSLQGHLESMTRGVIALSDVLFFLSLTIFGLLVAFRGLEKRRWS